MLFNKINEYIYKPSGEPMLPEEYSGLVHIARQINSCPRFVLDRAATMMVENVTLQCKESTDIRSVLPLCRLPYQKMWVELAFNDRYEHVLELQRRGHKIPDYIDSVKPNRVGLLLEHPQGDTSIITVQPVWNFGNMVRFATKVAVVHLTQDDCERANYVVPPYMEGFWNVVHSMSQEIIDYAEGAVEYDLSGEPMFAMGLMITMNSRNLLSVEAEEDMSKINKARFKTGKPKLLSHKPVSLNLSPAMRRRVISMATGQGAGEYAPHLVRGHFKVRKTGIFWWSPHARGPDSDIKPKDYRVTAS